MADVVYRVLQAANLFQVLELSVTDAPHTYEDLRIAFKRQALLVHPDKNASNLQEDAHKAFQRVSEAFETLADPTLQAIHLRKARTTTNQPATPSGERKQTNEEPVRRHRRKWWEEVDIDVLDEELSRFDAMLKEEIEKQRAAEEERAKRKREQMEANNNLVRHSIESELQARAASGGLEASANAWQSWRSHGSRSNEKDKPFSRRRIQTNNSTAS